MSDVMAQPELRAAMWRYRCDVVLRELSKVLKHPGCQAILAPETAELFADWERQIWEEVRKK
jgi:hypothetical protein